MKIAFVSTDNPNNKIIRSGVPYSIYHQLQQRCDVFWVKPEMEGYISSFLLMVHRLFLKVLRLLKYGTLHQTPLLAKLYCKSVKKQLSNKDYDAIFCLDCVCFAYLNINKPIFYRTDAIIHGFIDYYVFHVPSFLQRWVKSVEKKALKKCTYFFAPSQWIIDTIVENRLDINLRKIILVETGANINDEFVKYVPRTYNINMQLNMLIVGYNIKRKGIDEAFETVKILNEKYNVSTQLTVIGGRPDEQILYSGYVRYLGKLDKNISTDYERFYEQFCCANLFIFPTKAECHGIVNCEAAAYGLPIFSYQTGGVPNYCIDGYNGLCLPMSATGGDFAEKIYKAITSGAMETYSRNSRHLYEEKLNWNSWGQHVFPYIKNAVHNNR